MDTKFIRVSDIKVGDEIMFPTVLAEVQSLGNTTQGVYPVTVKSLSTQLTVDEKFVESQRTQIHFNIGWRSQWLPCSYTFELPDKDTALMDDFTLIGRQRPTTYKGVCIE